jgi:iron(III) transport system permease protein
MAWSLFQNSLLVGGMTALFAGTLGFVAAVALKGMDGRWRSWLLPATVIALGLPPFLVTNCWLDLLGNNGTWRTWLPFNLYSLGGAVWLLTLLYWPITALFVLGAWSQLEASQLEIEPLMRGGRLVRHLLWPMGRVAAGQAAVLTFVLALNNFSVPVILQVRVFPEELWLAFTTRLNEEGAWTASWPLVAAPLILVACLRRADIAWPRREGIGIAPALRQQLGWTWLWLVRVVTAGLLVLSVALPLRQFALNSQTWTELPNLFRAAPDIIWNSFIFAAAAATICTVIGLATCRLRIGPILWLLFLIPGVLLGRTMISTFKGTVVYGTSAMVIVAFTLRYLALGWNGVALACRGMDRDLVDAARVGGAHGWSLLRRVVWPQIASQVVAAWYVTYLLSLWDVETLVLIYPPGGETLALRIFNLLHYGHNAQVNALCVTLLALALAPLLLWAGWRSRKRPQNDL